MTETLWLVLALSLPSVLVAMVLAVLLIRRKAQERRAVELLLAAVKNAEAEYRQVLLAKLGDDDVLAEKSADKLVKQRRQYFKQVLSALLDRKPTGLLVIETALRQFSEAHLQSLAALASAKSAAPAPAAISPALAPAAPPADAGEAALRGENDRLRREVGLTLSALNNIFAEYASMFGDEHTRRDMNLEEILNSMQQLASGQPAEPESAAIGENRPLVAAEPAGDEAESANEPIELAPDDGALASDEAELPAGDPFAETEPEAAANGAADADPAAPTTKL